MAAVGKLFLIFIDIEQDFIPQEIIRSKASYKIDVINNEQTNEVKEESKSKELEDNGIGYCLAGNLNTLKLNRMTWLTEGERNSDNNSISTSCERKRKRKPKISEKHLSTIINLDKEHNLFGMSNISLSTSKWKKSRNKRRDGPVFVQNIIVFECLVNSCCRHKSKSDLPASLKCGGCGARGYCRPCATRNNCALKESCMTVGCTSTYPISCASRCCFTNCATCRGLKIILKKKTKYVTSPIEIASRAPSILQKPQASRVCSHTPTCISPSSCFPYLSPCYWPARRSAPCSHPERCFHNPPCPHPRVPKIKNAPNTESVMEKK